MRFGIERIASKGLQGLNLELQEGIGIHLVAPSEQGQVSDCVNQNIQTIAAGPSQWLIVDILNDVMRFELECIASKGLHGVNLELKERRKLVCGPK